MAYINNPISIRAKMVTALSSNKYKGLARTNINTKVIFAKQELLELFDNHIVTKELLQNPNKEGSVLVDHGNLVTFLGLEDGSLVVGELRNILENEIQLDGSQPKITNDKNHIYYNFRIKIPTKTSINERFPSPDNFSSRSIIELIEKGLGNAMSYIFSKVGFSFGGSRSGFGLQLKDKDGNPKKRKLGGSFKPTKYISELIDNFKKKF